MIRHLLLCGILIASLAAVTVQQSGAVLMPTAVRATDQTERVNLNSNGSQANEDSDRPDISGNGRYVVFSSRATNLIAGDSNGKQDIFLHDRDTGITTRVSNRTGGEQANGDSFAPAISSDGRIIVFYSLASNLVADDTNGKTDIFAHNRENGQTELVSVVLNGSANGDSRDPDVSGDGRYVAFTSSASNLVGGDNNLKDDIYRWDLVARTMERISVSSAELEANNHSSTPSISGDGQRIVFTSSANDLIIGDTNGLPDIFMRNSTDGTTIRVSLNSNGDQANGDSWDPAISNDGAIVVFTSLSSNLSAGDNNGYADVFLRQVNSNQTERVSLASNGSQGNDWAEEPSVSGNGRYVSFQSAASNLVSGDVPNTQDVFIRDRVSNTLSRASNSSASNGGNGASTAPALAANGRYVSYASRASNLVIGDSNGKRDIFVTDYFGQPTLLINFTTGAPGSTFVLTGDKWNANEAADVVVSGSTLGQVTADANGRLQFQLLTTAATEQGVYSVTVSQAAFVAYSVFSLSASAPLRPGTGGGFNIPNNSALTEFLFLPIIKR